jgi:hypothetical protein
MISSQSGQEAAATFAHKPKRNLLEGIVMPLDVQPLTVEYQLESADYIAFSAELRRFAPNSLSRLYYYGIIPALCVGLALATESFPAAIIFTALYVSSGSLVRIWYEKSYKRAVYSADNLCLRLCRWQVALTDEGVSFVSEAAVVLYRWQFVRQVFRGPRYVQFEITPIERMHIPVKAFRDEEHMQKFIDAANAHVKGAADGKNV